MYLLYVFFVWIFYFFLFLFFFLLFFLFRIEKLVIYPVINYSRYIRIWFTVRANIKPSHLVAINYFRYRQRECSKKRPIVFSIIWNSNCRFISLLFLGLFNFYFEIKLTKTWLDKHNLIVKLYSFYTHYTKYWQNSLCSCEWWLICLNIRLNWLLNQCNQNPHSPIITNWM